MKIQKYNFEDLAAVKINNGFEALDWAEGQVSEPLEDEVAPISEQEAEAREKAAAEAAYSSGFNDGKAAAIEETQSLLKQEEVENARNLNMALGKLSAQFQHINSELVRIEQQSEASCVALALTVARKVCSNIIDENAAIIVQNAVSSALKQLYLVPDLEIHVNPSIREKLELEIQNIRSASGYTGKITIVSRDALPHSDVVIDWKEGFAKRDTSKIFSDIEKLLAVSSMPDVELGSNDTARKLDEYTQTDEQIIKSDENITPGE